MAIIIQYAGTRPYPARGAGTWIRRHSPGISPRCPIRRTSDQPPRQHIKSPQPRLREHPPPPPQGATRPLYLTMPASDYTSTVSGGLKLKGGAKDAGVKKKGKKSKSSKDKTPKPSSQDESTAAGDSKTPETALALSDRDATPSEQPSSSGAGKTEAQRRHEEIKRKRVSSRYFAVKTSAQY